MHALVVRVTINDTDGVEEQLRNEVVPRMRPARWRSVCHSTCPMASSSKARKSARWSQTPNGHRSGRSTRKERPSFPDALC
jgi:hypothetical protein